MIKILKSAESGFAELGQIEEHCWVSVSSPNADEIQRLSIDHDIPYDFLIDSLDVDEMSRIETEGETVLIVIRVPKFDKNKLDVPFSTLPIGIVIQKNVIFTICSSDIFELLNLYNSKWKHFPSINIIRFLLQLFQITAFSYLRYLKEINKISNEIEMELQKATRNEELIKLLNIEKSLVFFATSLKSNELMMERLGKFKSLNLKEDDKDFLEDVIIDNKQAIEMANIYSNILSGMMDAFASVISNNLNIIMKFLTSVTIILMIPTLTASVYGMNVELPFQHSSHAFFITVGISFILSVIGVLILQKKKWL